MKTTIALLRKRLQPIYGERETEAIIRLIFEHLKGWRPVDIILHSDDELSEFITNKIAEILRRLLRHEPIQYIIGKAYFYGLEFSVNPSVLIPRPETEELVKMLIDRAGQREDLHILDACTGSGCIALTLARNLRFPHITAIDISDNALAVAKENAKNLHAQINLIKADALSLTADSIPGAPWDFIISNPPYIDESEKKDMEKNVLDYEPAIALFVPDNDSLKFYKSIAHYGMLTLRAGGYIYFEINPLHAEAMLKMMSDMGFDNCLITKDMQGRNRYLTAQKPSDKWA